MELHGKAKPKKRGCGWAPVRLGKPTEDGKRLRACEKCLDLHGKAKLKYGGGGVGGEAPPVLGKATDDGQRYGACEKRLVLQ